MSKAKLYAPTVGTYSHFMNRNSRPAKRQRFSAPRRTKAGIFESIKRPSFLRRLWLDLLFFLKRFL